MASPQYEKDYMENSADLISAVTSRTFSVSVRDLEMFVFVDFLGFPELKGHNSQLQRHCNHSIILGLMLLWWGFWSFPKSARQIW